MDTTSHRSEPGGAAPRLTPAEVKAIVGDTPNMTLAQGEAITRLIHEHRIRDVLELGIGHGVSACYMAAALANAGGGSIVTLDLKSQKQRSPNVEDLIARCGLGDLVTIYRDPTSYTWQLMKFLQRDPQPRFDLCYLDGAHNWAVDGFAFHLVDRLLKPGGWIVFDDLDWTYASSPSLKDTDFVRAMPADERELPQVRLVYELLVRTHPNYGEFQVKDDWAYARKLSERATGPSEVRTETVHVRYSPLTERLLRRVYRLLGR